ncbi:aldo/keto reductase [Aliagarivorans marinus]|uniref:aldo/keto reductase n=1 Tax=Aliagarivorans marinus TaxID=561965 RepID=UPI0004281C16|nr:aldo/keto reductase [Aliagarivorans marinus]
MQTLNILDAASSRLGGAKLSPLILGSGSFLTEQDKSRAFDLLDTFFSLGGRIIDTARQYGISENIICEWLDARGKREQVVILTKGGHPTLQHPKRSRLSPTELVHDLETSLEALACNSVALYALHRDDPSLDVAPIMQQLHQFVEEGKVAAIGTSNWCVERIIKANHYALEHDLTPFSFNSPGFSLAHSSRPRWPGCILADRDMLAWHQQSQAALLAWSPLGGGFFSGKYAPEKRDNFEMVELYYSEDNWEKLRRASELAELHGLSPSQVALAYVLNQPFPCAAIVGASRVEQLQQAFVASELALTKQQLAWLALEVD